MNFSTILRTLVDDCGGGVAAALMGSDGIPIELVEASNLPAPFAAEADELPDRLGAIGVEFGRVLDETRKASDSVGGGTMDELVVQSARFWVVLRSVDEDTFLVVVLAPEGNVGKARFLARRSLLSLREQM